VPLRPPSSGWTVSPDLCAASGSASPSLHAFQSGVQMFPGETALTRTPLLASSMASDLVKAVIAPLVQTRVALCHRPSSAGIRRDSLHNSDQARTYINTSDRARAQWRHRPRPEQTLVAA
jgi:hypothetical protein